MHEHVLVPPFRFRCVEHGVYVGAYPTLRNFRYLKRLKLHTIVAVIPEKPTKDLQEFCEKQNIKIIHFKAPKYKETTSTTPEQVNSIIETLIDTRNHPIYLHCLDGSNVSQNIIMCLRKLEYWDMKSILIEGKRYTEGLSTDEEEFLKNWKGPIQVPEGHLPNWLYQSWWQGESVHPTVELKFLHKKQIQKTRKNLNSIKITVHPAAYYPPYIEAPTLSSYSLLKENYVFSRELESLSLELKHNKQELSTEIKKEDLFLPENVIEKLEQMESSILFDPSNL